MGDVDDMDDMQESEAPAQSGDVYRFLSCEVDTIRRELRSDGELIDVQPKVFDLLVYLIEHRDRMVDKDELLDNIWPGAVVTESSLSQAIRKARSIVGDDGNRQQVIRTMHRRGFRFVAPIEIVATQSAPAPASATEAFTTDGRLYYAIAGMVVFIAAFAWILQRPGDVSSGSQRTEGVAATAPENSIAVLPFVDLSAAKDAEYFSDGLADELLNVLTRLPTLRVAARTSSFAFKESGLDAPAIARRLNVSYVLEGSVRESDGRVRVKVSLVRADENNQVWSRTFDRRLDDIFAIQDEIARAVAQSLNITMLGNESLAGADLDAEAFSIFLRGRHLLRQSTPQTIEDAIRLFEQALDIDPEFARAWHLLGPAYIRQANFGIVDRDEGYDMGRSAIVRAIDADAEFGEAYAQLGWLALHYDWDIKGARIFLDRALALPPLSYETISYAATIEANLGNLDAAASLREQVVAMDPLGRGGFHQLGVAYLFGGKFEQAEAMFRRALSLSPEYLSGNYYLGLTQLLQGDAAAALAAFERERDEGWRLEGQALANYTLGEHEASEDALVALKLKFGKDMIFQIGEVHAWRGDVDDAFRWLDRAYEARDGGLWDTLGNPLLANLDGDPRLPELLDKLGLND